jgi:hypothetical protein
VLRQRLELHGRLIAEFLSSLALLHHLSPDALKGLVPFMKVSGRRAGRLEQMLVLQNFVLFSPDVSLLFLP